METSKLISQAEEKISNLQNEYTLISDNSESKFDEIKEVYSEYYNFQKRTKVFSKKINVLKDQFYQYTLMILKVLNRILLIMEY